MHDFEFPGETAGKIIGELPESEKANQLLAAFKGQLHNHMEDKMKEHQGRLTYEEMMEYVAHNFGPLKSTTLRDDFRDTPSPSVWNPSGLLFFQGEHSKRKDRYLAASGSISLTEKRSIIEKKVPVWLLKELTDAETDKQLRDYWITIEGFPTGQSTGDMARRLRAAMPVDIRESLQEQRPYRVRFGQQ